MYEFNWNNCWGKRLLEIIFLMEKSFYGENDTCTENDCRMSGFKRWIKNGGQRNVKIEWSDVNQFIVCRCLWPQRKNVISSYLYIFLKLSLCWMVRNAVKTKANEKSGFKLVRICICEAANVESILIEMNFFSYHWSGSIYQTKL